MEDFQVLKKNPFWDKKNTKSGSFSSFRNQKWRILEKKNTKSGGLEVYSDRNPHFWEENHQKWRFFKFWRKVHIEKPPKVEVFQVLKKNPLKKKKKRGGFSSFRNQKGGILRKKNTKSGGFCSKIAFFGEKKNTKSGGFCNLKYGRSCLHRVFFTSPGNHQKWRSL